MFSHNINNLDDKSSTEHPIEFKERILADAKYPLQRKTSWPDDRNLTRYLQLHYPKLHSNYDDPALQVTLGGLPAKHIIVDAGAGEGLALAQMKTSENMTVGFSVHNVEECNLPQIDVMCYSPIPNGRQARAVFAALRGRTHRVFDTYGPGTYSSIHSLVYCGLLLSEDATAHIIISSVLHEHIDQSPIGYAGTRKRLIELFKDAFHLEMTIARTYIRSAVQVGATCMDFTVTIKRPRHAKTNTDSLDNLFALVDYALGKPVSIPKTTNWGNFEDDFKIEGKAFLLSGETNLQPHDWQSAVSAVHMDYVMQNKIGIRFHLQFDEPESCSIFATQFSEFFICHPKPDWQIIKISTDACTITYYDQATADKIHLSVSKAINELNQAELNMPGAANAEAEKLSLEKTAVVIFKRRQGHQPLLFKIPDGRNELKSLKNTNELIRK